MRHRLSAALLAASWGALFLGCDATTDATVPEAVVAVDLVADLVPESSLDFLEWGPAGPAIETMETSFWALRGEKREQEIHYEDWSTGGSGRRFLRLRIREKSLLSRPDGTLLASGDSIQIHIVVDAVRLMVTLEPTGLAFDPAEPAELELRFEGISTVSAEDETAVGLRRQESPGALWELLGPVRVKSPDRIRVEAELLSFTRYALAIGR